MLQYAYYNRHLQLLLEINVFLIILRFQSPHCARKFIEDHSLQSINVFIAKIGSEISIQYGITAMLRRMLQRCTRK